MKDDQQQKHDRKARQAVAKAQTNRDKARWKLLRQRKKLARRRTRNRQLSQHERTDDKDDEDTTKGSRNPTAHSTLPPQNTNAENAARNSHSTVPPAPMYSNVPARERLYGRRLHRKTTQSEDASQRAAPASEADTAEDSADDE